MLASTKRSKVNDDFQTFIVQIFKMVKIYLVLVVMTWLTCVQSHTYYLGSCPTVEPMDSFDMDKVWLHFVTSLKFKFKKKLLEKLV